MIIEILWIIIVCLYTSLVWWVSPPRLDSIKDHKLFQVINKAKDPEVKNYNMIYPNRRKALIHFNIVKARK